MYSVAQTGGFSLNAEFAKTHFVSNQSIAGEVKADLESRFGPMKVTKEAKNVVTYDCGGMLMMGDKEFDFDLGDIIINCKAQHLNHLIASLHDKQPRGTTTQYIKLHGHYCCICIMPAEYEQLVIQANNPALIQQANEAEEDREQRIQSVVDSGHLVRVAKDAAGNLIDVDKVAKRAKGNN